MTPLLQFACSHGVPLRPLCCGRVVLLPVRLVNVGDLGGQRIIGVRVRQQRADGQEYLRDGESG